MEAARTVKAQKSQNVISTLGPAQIQAEGKQTPCGMGGIVAAIFGNDLHNI